MPASRVSGVWSAYLLTTTCARSEASALRWSWTVVGPGYNNGVNPHTWDFSLGAGTVPPGFPYFETVSSTATERRVRMKFTPTTAGTYVFSFYAYGLTDPATTPVNHGYSYTGPITLVVTP